jgi:hypothetical protein
MGKKRIVKQEGQRPNKIKDTGISSGIGARGSTDRTLININNFINIRQSFDRGMFTRFFFGTIKIFTERLGQNIDNQC